MKIINEINNLRKKIHITIFIVIILTAAVIVISGLAAGAGFLTNSIKKTIEDDMRVAVEIADMYVTNEIDILKLTTAQAALEIRLLFETGEKTIPENILEKYPKYIGMAVYNSTNLLDSCGDLSLPSDLCCFPFMQIAFNGGQAVSTTMHTLDGSLVMYVSAPVNEELVLAAVLPGMYLSERVSRFTFWQTGHLFIDDEDGNIISNIRPEWVMERRNFIDLAKTDSNYIDAGLMVERGIAGEEGVGYFSIGGVPRISAFRPISSENENWFIGIIAPLAESALHDIPEGLVLIGIITLIMSIIAALLASAFLKRPYMEVDRLRRAAEIASIFKSTFLANMSHEIRTPMNSIVGFSELAQDDDISLKTKDYLNKIKTNAEWLLQIINDILDISKIESGKMELECIPFDIHELFTSCRTMIIPKAAEKGIMLHFYAEPSLGKRPLGDPTRLRQVFLNLLSNAIKFTNTGMVKLYSQIISKKDNFITIRFEIKDSGIGMTKEQIEKIFDPFIQAESGITRKYGGTGLGLSITKNIIELMGGKLLVESTPGVGSKFIFDIKFETIDINEEDLLERKIILHEIDKPAFKGEILLCEDNIMNQQVICEHLARVGLKTIVAENGKIGVDIVKSRKEKNEKQFDIIFMDMHMPVMDGIEASVEIQKLNTDIPIIALTANIMTNDREIYKANGIYDCLGKPFTSQELWRCLMRYFKPVEVSYKNELIESDNEFQKKIQIMFYKNNQNKHEEIINALQNNDIKLAHRLAHTLKSNAGQIGKKLLQNAAAVVEEQLKDGNNLVTDNQLKALGAELKMVLNELSSLLETGGFENNVQKHHTEPVDSQTERELLGKLEPLLKSGNPECLKFLKELCIIEGTEELARQIEDFEFEAAFTTLNKLKERMG